MTINRLRTRREYWFFLIKIAYILVGLPILLLIGIFMLLSMPPPQNRVPGVVEGTALIWLAIIIPVGIFIYSFITRGRLLKSIVRGLRSPEYFAPDENLEMFHEGDCKYLGIDIRHGTILYVHKIRSGQMDVIGLTMADWTMKEVQGNVFRLYTKHPELPMIQIGTPWAKRWYDTLDAMAHKPYSTPQPFSQYLAAHLKTLQSKHRVHIPTFS